MTRITPFSGSYGADDIQFLLRPVEIEMTPVLVKEQLIQSGAKHYSDMLSQEPAPTAYHLDLFGKALDQSAARMAAEVVMLAKALIERLGDTPIVLVSLVRAGAPLGVMLHQAIKDMGKTSYHYGISIVRDRGIDEYALAHIEQLHGTDGIVFVDGWTGKGAIMGQLTKSLAGRAGYPEQPRLVVLADPCGCSWLAATNDDWLIPFGIMGAPVSGMISRSIWSDEGLHGCVKCDHLSEFDCSQQLVDTVAECRHQLDIAKTPTIDVDSHLNASLINTSQQVVQALATRYGIGSSNRIKPGIAEATRALLRRVPEHVLVRSINDPDVALLLYLARQKNIVITEVGALLGQYRAITIIKQVT